MKIKKVVNLIVVLILLGLIGMFLCDHLRLGLVRFLDLDESAYLHWSYNAFSSLLPYKDFFFGFTPFYLYFIVPILHLTGKTFAYVTGARIVTFLVFCLGVIFLYAIAKNTKKSHLFALFTVLIFAYLPLPEDKWLEVRPDGLGIVLSLVGVWLMSLAINTKRYYFLAGFFMSLGFVINPKTLFFLLPAFFILLCDIFFSIRVKRKEEYQWKNNLLPFFGGAALPIGILLGLFCIFGDFPRAFYSVFILQKNAGVLLSGKNPMKPDLFFYPNNIYYGEVGYNFNYFANLFIYLLAAITAIVRLFSFLTEEGREKILIGLFLPLLFLTNLVAFIKFFPLKHTQYLMGVSPWVAYFFTDLVFAAAIFLKNRGKVGKVALGLIFFIFTTLLGLYGHKMNMVKASRSLSDSIRFLEDAKSNFSDDEYIFDLTGASLFYKDPYYVCCLPYGEYLEVIKYKLPDLESALRGKEVKHVFIQFPDRLKVLPIYQQKILNRFYTAVPDMPNSILAAGARVDFGKESQGEFELITKGWYKIYWNDGYMASKQLAKTILLDEKIILTNPVYMDKGQYTLTRLGEEGVAKFVYIKK